MPGLFSGRNTNLLNLRFAPNFVKIPLKEPIRAINVLGFLLQCRYLAVGNIVNGRMNMRFLIKNVLVSCFLLVSISTLLRSQQIKWMTFEEAIEAHDQTKKKIFVDIFTDWCTWCQKMDQSTFQNAFIAGYINEHYYPVKFNAEQQTKIIFNGKDYNYVKSGRRGYHELAVELALGRLSYPTVVFLDENLQVIQALRGFQSALRFEQIMTYFAQDFHKTTPWSKFSENYQTFISHH